MSVALADYFADVHSSDVFDYGFGSISDFLKAKPVVPYDWVITNPPFRLAEDFIDRSLKIARHGVAMLVRTVFIESVGRYERLFKTRAPQFSLSLQSGSRWLRAASTGRHRRLLATPGSFG